MLDSGYDLVVADASCSFRAPAKFDDELDFELTISRMGTTSMTTSIAEKRDGELLAEGKLVHVFVDPEALSKLEIPTDIRERLAPWVTD